LLRVTARKDQGFMSVHSIVEMYAALTRLPVQPRIHPVEAARVIQDNILPHFEAMPVGRKDYIEALRVIGYGGCPVQRLGEDPAFRLSRQSLPPPENLALP
jgi:hypothetical protein